jgi:hypothetical protein
MLSVHDFGRQLIATKDLDPIYVMLNAAELDWDTRARFCLAYWMFYHAGVAAACAEKDKDFWGQVWTAQDLKWPRGTERRHFKGNASMNAIADLQACFPEPEKAVAWIAGQDQPEGPEPQPIPFLHVRELVLQWHGFGPWIAFKVADMVDAVLDVEVDFKGAESYFFDDPMKGGAWVTMLGMGMHFDPFTFNARYDQASPAVKLAHLKLALNYLAEDLGTLPCPHNPTRTLRLQEYETILCKYKSHLNGRYEPGKDTKEIIHALEGWGDLADHLKATLMMRWRAL